MRRPGFLAGTDYWFGEAWKPTDLPDNWWRRSSSRPSDEHLYPQEQTRIEWHKQGWVEDPVWTRYV